MRVRYTVLVAALIGLAASGAAAASVTPRHPASFFFVKSGAFSITLDTKTATKIAAGNPNAAGLQVPVSNILVLCSAKGPGGKVLELHIGFPGATLKLTKRHYGFIRLYTDKHARRDVLGTHTSTALPARVKVNGAVTSATLITGTVSVAATGCDLKPVNYKARFFRALPRRTARNRGLGA